MRKTIFITILPISKYLVSNGKQPSITISLTIPWDFLQQQKIKIKLLSNKQLADFPKPLAHFPRPTTTLVEIIEPFRHVVFLYSETLFSSSINIWVELKMFPKFIFAFYFCLTDQLKFHFHIQNAIQFFMCICFHSTGVSFNSCPIPPLFQGVTVSCSIPICKTDGGNCAGHS